MVEALEVYTCQVVDNIFVPVPTTPIEDPLIVNIKGSLYFMGRREVGPYIMVWPYQRDEKTKGGIILSQQSLDSDPYNNRYGKVLEIGPTAWTYAPFFPKPRCYDQDWVIYRRFETQIWGHKVLAEKCPETGLVSMSQQEGEAIVVGKVLPEYIYHAFPGNVNPDFIDTNKHIGR